VREAVSQAGGNVVTVAALREPVDLAGLGRDAAGTHFAALQEATGSSTAQLQLLERFGALAGTQLVSGGQAVAHELLSRARGQLLSAFDGQLGRLEGLVVARTEPAGMSTEAAQAASALEAGLVRGAASAGVATVGVELSSTQPSQVPWYEGHGISSVDDLDATAGRAALAYTLAGARGAYGTKGTANSLLPPVTSLGEHL
jgi:Copper transport outer membrane protein, MctB